MKPLRILVVEDDAMVAMVLAMTLDQMGHKVCGVEATEQGAVKAAASLQPDLIIVDASLGGGDGVSAVEQILHAGPAPHFFTSGDPVRVTSRRPDAVVIQKPFREADLAGAIERAMGAAAA
jgi:two-component system, response regulator PdtaR